jgi:hypothetical protein
VFTKQDPQAFSTRHVHLELRSRTHAILATDQHLFLKKYVETHDENAFVQKLLKMSAFLAQHLEAKTNEEIEECKNELCRLVAGVSTPDQFI